MEQLEIDFCAAARASQSRQVAVGGKASQSNRRDNGIGRLWQQITEKKRLLTNTRHRLDELLRWLDDEIADDRAAVAEALTELTERLLQHLGKKSLAQWQRLEVALWVLDNIESLDGFGRDTQDFKKRYQVLFEQFYEPPEPVDIPDDTDWLSQVFADLQTPDPDVADEDDITAVREEQPRPGPSANAEGAGESGGATALSTAFVTRLFRRTAKVLHPDLADSDSQRDRNDELMKRLLQARREQDVATIFAMYFEHVGSPDLDAGAADLVQLRKLLQRQLQNLQADLAALTGQSPLHRWAVDNLLDHTEAEQRRALGRMRAELDEIGRQARAITRRARTLASLKPLLAERHDGRVFS